MGERGRTGLLWQAIVLSSSAIVSINIVLSIFSLSLSLSLSLRFVSFFLFPHLSSFSLSPHCQLIFSHFHLQFLTISSLPLSPDSLPLSTRAWNQFYLLTLIFTSPLRCRKETGEGEKRVPGEREREREREKEFRSEREENARLREGSANRGREKMKLTVVTDHSSGGGVNDERSERGGWRLTIATWWSCRLRWTTATWWSMANDGAKRVTAGTTTAKG